MGMGVWSGLWWDSLDACFAVVLGCPVWQWAAPETCAYSLFCNVLYMLLMFFLGCILVFVLCIRAFI